MSFSWTSTRCYKVRTSYSSSYSSLVLDKILTPEEEHEEEDEYEKYQIRLPESALIWNYKVSSTIKLAASRASSWADNYPQAIQPWPITYNP